MSSLPLPPSFIKRHTYQVNGFTFRTVLVEKGKFSMGYSREKSGHEVTITSDFELAEHPVTQAMWEAVMGQEWHIVRSKGSERPVERVNWDDTQWFIMVLNTLYRKDNNFAIHPGFFCLPTEAQWDYAARGGQFNSFFNYPYSGSTRLEEVGWYTENSHRETQPVTSKLNNVLSIFCMNGNVWEWCEDDWHNNTEGIHSDGSAWIEIPRSAYRVIRGASWRSDTDHSLAAYRSNHHSNGLRSDLGFRIAFIPQSDSQ